MAIISPPDFMRTRVTGVAFSLVPGRDDQTGRPWVGLSEVRRAPDSGGLPVTASAVTIADSVPPLPPGGAPFVDERPGTTTRWHYSWRHKGLGRGAGNWSAWFSATPDVVPKDILAAAISSSGGGSTGTGALPLARSAEVLDRNLGDKGAVTTTIDWADGGGATRRIRLTASGGTILFKNGKPGQGYTLVLQQDETGARTISTWDPGIAWPADAAPTLTTTIDRADMLVFKCVTTGGNVRYLGRLEQANYIQNDVKAAVGSFLVDSSFAATTDIVVTGVGFMPKLLIFFTSGRSEAVDAAGRADYYMNFGAATSTSLRRGITNWSDDGVATSAAFRYMATDAVINEIDAAGRTGALDVQSFDADGFTVRVDDQFVSSKQVHWLALGGDTFKAKIADRTTPGSAGSQTTTGVGFTPTGLILAGVDVTGAASLQVDAAMGIGVATSSGAQYATASVVANAQTTQKPTSYGYTGECYANGQVSGAPPDTDATLFRAAFTSFGSDQFVLNWLETLSVRTDFYIALAGCRCVAGNLATVTDTTTDITVTGLAVVPKAGLLISHARPTSTQNVSDNDAQRSTGVFAENPQGGAPIQRTAGVMQKFDASAASVVAGAGHAFDAAYQNLDVADGALEGRMRVTAITPGGFTARMDDADPSAARVGYLVIGV